MIMVNKQHGCLLIQLVIENSLSLLKIEKLKLIIVNGWDFSMIYFQKKNHYETNHIQFAEL